MLKSMGLQRAGHDLLTEKQLNIALNITKPFKDQNILRIKPLYISANKTSLLLSASSTPVESGQLGAGQDRWTHLLQWRGMQHMIRHQNRFFLAFSAFLRKNFSDSIPSQSESQGSPFLCKIIFLACHGPHILAKFPKYSCHAPHPPRGILRGKYVL